MTKEELTQSLTDVFNNTDSTAVVYALLKNNGVKKLDIENIALQPLKDMFFEYVKLIIIDNEELSLLALSSADERANAIYEYDLDFPSDFSCFDTILSSNADDLFSVSNNEVNEIKALLIEIGNHEKQIVLYKSLQPVNIFDSKRFFLGYVKSDHRFVRIDDDFIRISQNFQFIKIDEKLLVLDLKSLERFFGFHEVIKREAALGVTAIEARSLLSNPETLRELIDDVSFARKLVKVAKGSPVLKAGIENQKIIEFCRNYSSIKGKIKFNEIGDKIVLDTNVSKQLFIKILMDDFLTSELTEFHYLSVAKDGLEETANSQVHDA